MKTLHTFSQILNEQSTVYSFGSRGEEVRKIQQKLIDLGLLKITAPTGVFGQKTKDAVKVFQGNNDLEPDGKVGPLTYPKLMGKAAVSTTGTKDSSTTKTTTKNLTKTEQVTPVASDTDMIISDSLVDRNIKFDPKNDTTPFTCTETGCSAWVSNQLDDLGIPRQGNAWHAASINSDKVEFNVFKNFSPANLTEMARIFTLINAKPIERTQEWNIKSLVQKLFPDQASLKSLLQVNDIVGLYWSDSHNFTKAFFQGATGYLFNTKDEPASEQDITMTKDNGKKIAIGPFFKRADTGEAWKPADLGQKINFVAGDSLNGGKGFTFNTHLGYVGAIVQGEPIIFHNVHQQVHATPLSKMGSSVKILWIKKGEGSIIRKYAKKFFGIDL